MPDVISQGGSREPRPWRGRLVAIAVCAALATVLAVAHPGSRGHPPAPQPRQAVTVSRAPLAAAPAPGLPAVPDGIIGQSLLRDRAFRLPVTGKQPAWFWPATGRSEPIAGLPRDSLGYLFIRAGGGWAVQPNAGAQVGCGNCAAAPRPVYFLADRARSATRTGTAEQVAPAATVDALWLTSYPPGVDMGTTAGTAREVSAAGAPLRRPLTLPAGYVISRGAGRGLLLAAVRPGNTAELLWDPATAAAGRTFDGVIAASASAIAWAPRCSPLCAVEVLDLHTGRVTTVRMPGGSSIANGAFSPDGRYLALQVSFGPGGPHGGAAGPGGGTGALSMQLEVAAAASGRLTVVPGTWASSDALVGFGWPAAMDSLVAELSFPAKVQIASWRPGATRLAVAVITPGQNATSLIVR